MTDSDRVDPTSAADATSAGLTVPVPVRPGDRLDTVFFDGLCGWCQGSVRLLRWLDWHRRLVFVDYLSVPEAERPVSYATFMEGLPVRTWDGRVLVGFAGVRRALRRTPLGALVIWPLYLPGLGGLGRLIYRWIAANRPRACQMPASSDARTDEDARHD